VSRLAGPSRIDRLIGVVSPERALRRARARAALEAWSSFTGAPGYRGARGHRELRDWSTPTRSADADQLPRIERLRARSGDLVRNAPIAAGAIGTEVTSVVGGGLECQATIDREFLGLTEEQASAWERSAERYWRLACCEIDFTRKNHFHEQTDLVLRSQLERGDVLVVRRFGQRIRRGELFRTKVQLVEADRISTPRGRENEEHLIEGVEVDPASGAHQRYWIRKSIDPRYVAEKTEWQSVPAYSRADGSRAAFLIYDRLRVDQTRGVPKLAPVIEILKQLERYTEAEIAAAVVSSFFTVAIQSEDEEGLASGGPSGEPDSSDPTDSEKRDLKLQPAGILMLAENESASSLNPMRPNSSFDPFFLAVTRQIGMALQIPHEVLIKHFQASYSAARAAMLDAWRYFLSRRSRVVREWCNPVYGWVISEAVARGMLPAPGFFDDPVIRQAWLGTTWTGRPMGHVQPLQEINAVEKSIDLGIISESEATAEVRGADWEAVQRRRARDRALRGTFGLPDPGSSARAAAAAAEADPADDLPDEEDRA